MKADPMLLFPPYEAAVDSFYSVGGVSSKVTAIRSPRTLLDAFKDAFPDETTRELRYLGAAVELADTQDFVSVRGITSAGHDFEWPEPE